MEEMHNLYDAVTSINREKVELIMAKDFNLDTRDLQGNTLLHSVIVNEKSADVVKYVVELGFDVNALNNRKWSPLFVLRKYLEPNKSSRALHQWLTEQGAISKPDSLGEAW